MINFDNINKLLEEKNKSCYWLAKQCDMSQNNMAKICNGETKSIRFDTLEKICIALECTPNDLITTNDNELFNRLFAYYNAFNKLQKEKEDDTN